MTIVKKPGGGTVVIRKDEQDGAPEKVETVKGDNAEEKGMVIKGGLCQCCIRIFNPNFMGT